MSQNLSQTPISEMFNIISSKYDRINRILSFGTDRHWRKKLKSFLPKGEKLSLIDLATGTGDQLLTLMRTGKFEYGLGIDLAEEMLNIGQRKIANSPYEKNLELKVASALEIPSENGSFDCATISFGIRNVEDPLQVLKEMRRVLSPNGKALILEFSLPKNSLFRLFYLFYLRKVLPVLGGWLSGQKEAYKYLNQTIEAFLDKESFLLLMQQAGFEKVSATTLTLGIVTVYIGESL